MLLLHGRCGGRSDSGAVSLVRCAAASHGGVQQECEISRQGSDPHKGKHLTANIALNVELVLRREGNLGGNTNDGGDDCGYREDDACHTADEGCEEAEPSSSEDERGGEQEDEVEDDARHEEGVHDLGSDTEEGEDGDDFGGEGDFGAGEEFAYEDFDGIEPEEGFWLGAEGYASVEVKVSF